MSKRERGGKKKLSPKPREAKGNGHQNQPKRTNLREEQKKQPETCTTKKEESEVHSRKEIPKRKMTE